MVLVTVVDFAILITSLTWNGHPPTIGTFNREWANEVCVHVARVWKATSMGEVE